MADKAQLPPRVVELLLRLAHQARLESAGATTVRTADTAQPAAGEKAEEEENGGAS